MDSVAVEMPAYQLRVMAEKDELDTKIKKLQDFLNKATTSAMPLHERNIMTRQLGAMSDYSRCLDERILLFSLSAQEKGL